MASIQYEKGRLIYSLSFGFDTYPKNYRPPNQILRLNLKPFYAKQGEWQRTQFVTYLKRCVAGLVLLKVGIEFGNQDAKDNKLASLQVVDFESADQIFDLLYNQNKTAVFVLLYTPGHLINEELMREFQRESGRYMFSLQMGTEFHVKTEVPTHDGQLIFGVLIRNLVPIKRGSHQSQQQVTNNNDDYRVYEGPVSQAIEPVHKKRCGLEGSLPPRRFTFRRTRQNRVIRFCRAARIRNGNRVFLRAEWTARRQTNNNYTGLHSKFCIKDQSMQFLPSETHQFSE